MTEMLPVQCHKTQNNHIFLGFVLLWRTTSCRSVSLFSKVKSLCVLGGLDKQVGSVVSLRGFPRHLYFLCVWVWETSPLVLSLVLRSLSQGGLWHQWGIPSMELMYLLKLKSELGWSHQDIHTHTDTHIKSVSLVIKCRLLEKSWIKKTKFSICNIF